MKNWYLEGTLHLTISGTITPSLTLLDKYIAKQIYKRNSYLAYKFQSFSVTIPRSNEDIGRL